MNYSVGVCHIPMMPVRCEAKHASEMVNMILFGETFEILVSTDHWHQVKSTLDDYHGWVFGRKINRVHGDWILKYTNESPKYFGSLIDDVSKITLGSRLPLADDKTADLGNEKVNFSGRIINVPENRTGIDILNSSRLYLGTPYLWGGRSIAGIDCSGLTQMVFLLNGIKLPRDAWQQAEKGDEIVSLGEAKAGDLAFFAEKEKISHVGILTGDGHIIHASETVREDEINENGILNKDLNGYTLQVKMIRRFI